MNGNISVETVGFRMHPEDGLRARVRVLRNCSREELTRALELATACSLTFPGYGHRRTVIALRKALDGLK